MKVREKGNVNVHLYMGCSWLRAAIFDQEPLLDGTLSSQGHTHSLAHSVSVASRFPPTLFKITPFAAGLKGKCVRLNLPGLAAAFVAWAGGKIQHNSGSCSWSISHLCANAELAQGKVSFLKAQCWFVQFNDFLRYLFSYLFPLSKGSWLFNIF